MQRMPFRNDGHFETVPDLDLRRRRSQLRKANCSGSDRSSLKVFKKRAASETSRLTPQSERPLLIARANDGFVRNHDIAMGAMLDDPRRG
jgi:hypothetical protein